MLEWQNNGQTLAQVFSHLSVYFSLLILNSGVVYVTNSYCHNITGYCRQHHWYVPYSKSHPFSRVSKQFCCVQINVLTSLHQIDRCYHGNSWPIANADQSRSRICAKEKKGITLSPITNRSFDLLQLIDIKLSLKSPYVVIPTKGVYDRWVFVVCYMKWSYCMYIIDVYLQR